MPIVTRAESVDLCLEHLVVVLLPLASSCDCSWRILAAKSPSPDRQRLTPLGSVDAPPSDCPGVVQPACAHTYGVWLGVRVSFATHNARKMSNSKSRLTSVVCCERGGISLARSILDLPPQAPRHPRLAERLREALLLRVAIGFQLDCANGLRTTVASILNTR